MRCPACGHENRPDRLFCTECGASLAPVCPSCGAVGESGEKFCGRCGAKASESAAGEPSSPAPESHDGERRQLTVMFADLANSTALSGVLDPEDLRDALRRYHDACAEAITRCGGYVGKWLGDGVLAYFGYPASHEDDAQRAIRAGIEIISWAREQAHSGGEALAVRVGLHTGLTVIGDMGSGERVERADVVGETPNIAARVQSVAPPNSVVISGATERLAHGFFHIEALGEQQLKGVTRPIEVFRIIGESGAASRLDTVEHLTPLVGREEETALLLDRWNKAVTGDAQVVVISGEPGIGKSRLVRTLRDHLPQEHVRIELRCSQIHQNSALYPLIEHFQRVLQASDAGTPTDRLAATLRAAGMEATASLPLFASLLGLPLPEGCAALDLTPEQQKQKTLEATLAWLDAEARKHPVLVVCEDLHWMDPSTLELVGLLVERDLTSGKLVLLTCRPEFMPPWPMQANIAVLQLTRLGREDADEVMTRVAGGRALPAEVAAQIAARTDGVPLFVEELTKMVLESGLLREDGNRLVLDGALPPLAIPETLHDSLMARLDRLASVKEVAQLGATIGREFSHELIAAVSLQSPAVLAASLDALVESGLAYRRGFGAGARYAFKHALVQDAAYQSLLKSSRGRYHQRIGDALVQRFPDVAEEQPEVVAHHYTEAALPELAVGYWQIAGERAVARSAHPEAIAHLNRGLEALAALPVSEARDRQELDAQIALGSAYRANQGYTSRYAAAAYDRARELGYKLQAMTELVPILWGLWGFRLMRGEFAAAMALADECLVLAGRQSDPGYTVQAYRILAGSSCWLGEFENVRRYAAEGVRLYDAGRDASKLAQFQMDGFSSCVMYESWASWMLGFPETASRMIDDSLRHARSLNHPHTLAVVLMFSSGTRLFRRESERSRSEAEEATQISLDHGLPQWPPWGMVESGAALVGLGEFDSGLARIDEGIAVWRGSLESRVILPTFLGWKADALLTSGRPADALQAASEGLTVTHETGERVYEAELHRLHGEALRGVDDLAAERDFLRAIEVARELGAKSLELRAATSLARLWQSQRRAEALALLAPVYAWFTEGFDTRDLIEALALLDDLGFTSKVLDGAAP